MPDDVCIGNVLYKMGFPCMLSGTTLMNYPIIGYLWRYENTAIANINSLRLKPDVIFIRLRPNASILPSLPASWETYSQKYKLALITISNTQYSRWKSRVSLDTIYKLNLLHKETLEKMVCKKNKG